MSDQVTALATLRGELREEKEYAEALHESKAAAERALSKRRCIGCGRFIHPNCVMQCGDCDDRDPVDSFYDSPGIYGG